MTAWMWWPLALAAYVVIGLRTARWEVRQHPDTAEPVLATLMWPLIWFAVGCAHVGYLVELYARHGSDDADNEDVPR